MALLTLLVCVVAGVRRHVTLAVAWLVGTVLLAAGLVAVALFSLFSASEAWQ